MNSSEPYGKDDLHWSVLGPEVPEDLAGRLVLDVSDPGLAIDGSSEALLARGAREVVRWQPPGDIERDPSEGFDFVYCRDTLQRDPHPMNFLSRLWHLTAEGATLLLESRVIPAPEQSRYARFVAGAAGGDSSPEWLPGRLALRWSVETSGFDVGRWLPSPAGEPKDAQAVSAYLRATRVARQPALDLAIPGSSQ